MEHIMNTTKMTYTKPVLTLLNVAETASNSKGAEANENNNLHLNTGNS
jgi:hypothetical protein